MGRKPENPKREVQLLIRVTNQEAEVLSALAHLEDTTTPSLLYRIAQAEIARASDDPHVKAHIDNKRSYSAAKDTDVIDLARRRRKSTGPTP